MLDFTRVVAGPLCTMLLGDLGADVYKIEDPGVGDELRAYGPPFPGGESAYFLSVNRNKKSVVLDLRTEAGRAAAWELAIRSDVVIENFRPGFLDRLGLGWADLSKARSDVVYCSITAFGQDGPYRADPGYDLLVAALGGLLGITGEPGGEPVKPGAPMLDLMTGVFAYASIVAALLQRLQSGVGQRIDVSLMSVQLATLVYPISAFLNAGMVMQPTGSGHPALVPYQAFRAADGWVVIAAANEGLFGRLCSALGRPEWKDDPRFATNRDRVRNRDVLLSMLETVIRQATVEENVLRLREAGVPIAPVNSIDAVFDDPHVRFMDPVVDLPHPSVGRAKTIKPAVGFSRNPAVPQSAPPILGQHTDEVLQMLAEGRFGTESPARSAGR